MTPTAILIQIYIFIAIHCLSSRELQRVQIHHLVNMLTYLLSLRSSFRVAYVFFRIG